MLTCSEGRISAGVPRVDPGKVLGFLDLAGMWDPSLAFVMAGAIAVAAPAFAWVWLRNAAWRGAALQLPINRAVDWQLIAGSAIFGVGWGLADFCPGPAVVALGMGVGPAAAFVGAMLVGMAAFARWDRRPWVTGG